MVRLVCSRDGPMVRQHHEARHHRTPHPPRRKDPSMHDEPTGLGAALQSPERKRCSACQQVNPCTDFSSTNRGGSAPARSTHRGWASSSADLSTVTASRESYRTVSHHSVWYSALKRPLRIVCLRHGATTALSGASPTYGGGGMMLLLILIALVCVLFASGGASSDVCYCSHCHGRGCGGWCRWCR